MGGEAFWHVQEQQGDHCGCKRLTEETVVEVEFGEVLGQVGSVGHWKDLVLPLIRMGKLEQLHKNGRLTTELK